MAKFGKELLQRSLTAVLLVSIVCGAYLQSLTLFSLLLLAAFALILVDELPRLYPVRGIRFAALALIYPALPMIAVFLVPYFFYAADFYLPAYLFLIAATADTCAYLVGSCIGYTKMCPTISPGKSWEGFAGGFFGVVVVNCLILSRVVTQPFANLAQCSLLSLVYGLALTTMAFLGGLLLSWLKRKQSLKDAGSLLPGHGGLLDRFDSIFGVTVVFWLVVALARILG